MSWRQNRALQDQYLAALNSVTKFESIPTLHKLDERGVPRGDAQKPADPETPIEVSEKVDGVNTRIIVLQTSLKAPVNVFLASREEILFHLGDVSANHSVTGLIDATLDTAERFVNGLTMAVGPSIPIGLAVLYGEAYGHDVAGNKKAGRQYAANARGFRAFDLMLMGEQQFAALPKTPEELASWRKKGGQPFVERDRRAIVLDAMNIEPVPAFSNIKAGEIPTSVEDVAAWLRNLLAGGSRAVLDPAGEGKAEGLVLRTFDRSWMAKVRVEEYERGVKIGRSDRLAELRHKHHSATSTHGRIGALLEMRMVSEGLSIGQVSERSLITEDVVRRVFAGDQTIDVATFNRVKDAVGGFYDL